MRWALLPCLSSMLVVSALRGVFLEEKEMAHDMIQSLIFVLCPKKMFVSGESLLTSTGVLSLILHYVSISLDRLGMRSLVDLLERKIY